MHYAEDKLWVWFFSGIRKVQESSPIGLRWLNDDTMQIRWPNETKDLIFLSPKKKEQCVFTGKFEKDILANAKIEGRVSK